MGNDKERNGVRLKRLLLPLLLLSTQATAEEVYDRYDVRGLNRVAEIERSRVFYSNKDIKHIVRLPVAPKYIPNYIPPRIPTEAQRQINYSACVRSLRQTQAYQSQVKLWEKDSVGKAVAWQEEHNICLDKSTREWE